MNRLATQSSPYLLQHADNPVDWYPWGEEALAKAKADDKPIFLSIGYAACHWCHVMAHESFEDESTAAVMNELFVNVKVDREERPDLDSIYMDAVVSMTGHGGWPMSVFLTPDGVPFYGGTYFPPQPRHGLPGFKDVLRGVHEAWLSRRDRVLEGGREVLNAIRQNDLAALKGTDDLSPETLQQAIQMIWKQFDWRYAGWGGGPKFPQPMTLEFLMRMYVRTGDALALEMTTKTLDAMINGGMYDHLGGGFHRYATDATWTVPHFEKMLYDNSQLARVYLHAWQLTDNPRYRRCTEEVLDYVHREMTGASGGFFSTQDADSEGVEGKFFIWEQSEVDSILGERAPLFMAAYGVTAHGNFEGKNILVVASQTDSLAEKFNLPPQEVDRQLREARQLLFDHRERRIHPGLDDKVLSGWNGLMLAAFAEAARVLQRDDYLATAIANAQFLWREMRTGQGRLWRSWRNGEAKLNAYLEDYAGVIEGLLTLYEATFDAHWYSAAHELARTMVSHFADPNGGFFDTGDDHEALVVRPKSMQDNAVPSGNALAATALLRLAALSGDWQLADIAEGMLRSVQPILARHPTAFAQWLNALIYLLSEPKEVALVGDPASADLQALLAVAQRGYRPFQVVAAGLGDKAVPLLANREMRNGEATAYVCFHFACRQPVTTADALAAMLTAELPG